MTPRRTPDEVIDRALSLLRSGMFITEAAANVGITRQGLIRRMKQRGVDVSMLRPPLSSHKGVQYGPRTRRYPCRYCGSPVTKKGSACTDPECQRRKAADYKAEHPEVGRIRGERLLARADDGRRESGSYRYAPFSARGQRRSVVHVYLTKAEESSLRAFADGRRVSLSNLVASALRAYGVF